MLLSETLGERIVAKTSAETLGSVDGVVVDAGAHAIVAVRTGKGRKAQVVPWAALSGIGDAAVVVEHDDALREPEDGSEDDQATDDVKVLGALVLSDHGNEHGTVTDLEFDEQTGAISEIRTSRSTALAGDQLRAIGHYAWIVTAGDDELGGL